MEDISLVLLGSGGGWGFRTKLLVVFMFVNFHMMHSQTATTTNEM